MTTTRRTKPQPVAVWGTNRNTTRRFWARSGGRDEFREETIVRVRDEIFRDARPSRGSIPLDRK
jgi:hypothetical protein